LSIEPTDEVKSFKCHNCKRLIEIKDNSKEYVSINGNINYGENTLIIGNKTDNLQSNKVYRICINCLVNILNNKFDSFPFNSSPFGSVFNRFGFFTKEIKKYYK
jgi:hypothetical protein